MTTLALAAPRYGVSARLKPAPAAAPHVLDANRLGDHLDRLYRAALGMTGSPADAEDLVQDVCVRVLSKPRLVTNGDDLGYLLRVLRNTFISNRRTLARRPATATAPEDMERYESSRAADPERAFEARQLYARSPSCRSTSATRWWPSTCSGSPTRRPPRRWTCRPGRS